METELLGTYRCKMLRRTTAAIGTAAIVLAASIVGYRLEVFETSSPASVDFSFEGYRFGNPETVIDLGIQPLWLPGVISEVMRRDTILHEALAQRDLEIRFHPFLKGADVNSFIASRHLEAGIGGDMPALTGCSRSLVKVVSLIDRSLSSIIASTPMRVTDLRGKRVGYGYGSNAHRILLDALSRAGVKVDEVDLVPIDVNAMSEALARGSIDAFAAWPPTPTATLARLPSAAVVSDGVTTGYLYFERVFAESRPAMVREIVASQIRSMAWLRRRPSHLLAASGWTIEAGRELLGDTAPPSTEQWIAAATAGLLGTDAGATLPERDLRENGLLERSFHFLQRLGVISEAVRWQDVATCFDRTIVTDVESAGDEYRLDADDFVLGYNE